MKFLESVKVFTEANVPCPQLRETDMLHTLDINRGGKIGVTVGALIEVTYTAEETGAGGCTVEELWSVLNRVTLQPRSHMYANNVQGLTLIQQAVVDGILTEDNFADFINNTALTTGVGDTAVALRVPVIWAPEPFKGNWKNMDGVIPVSEWKSNAKITVTLGTDEFSTNWDVKYDYATINISLLVAYVDSMPEPVFQELHEKDETTTVITLNTKKGRPSRVLSAFMKDDATTDFTVSSVTAFSITIDNTIMLQGQDGTEHNRYLNLLRHSKNDLGSIGPTILGIIIPDCQGAEEAPLVQDEMKIEDGGAGVSGTYICVHKIQYLPTKKQRDSILLANGIPKAVVDQSAAEISENRNASIAYKGDVPAAVIPANLEPATSGITIPIEI